MQESGNQAVIEQFLEAAERRDFDAMEGKVCRTTENFGAPFPAQEFRAQYLDGG